MLAGTVNQNGTFSMKVEKVGIDTVLSGIIAMVCDAQGSKPPLRKLTDKLAGIFVPVIIGISLITFIIWLISDPVDGLTYGILSMVTVLVIACPCALGLAMPTAITMGVGIGAEKGILIKNVATLENAVKITAVVLDKTGTVTEGKPDVRQIIWYQDDEYFKRIFSSMEKFSEHPLAGAVVKYLGYKEMEPITDFRNIAGGITAVVNGVRYYAGNRKLMEKNGISLELNLSATEEIPDDKTNIWFATMGRVLAVATIEDVLRENVPDAVNKLKSMGMKIFMVTGDNQGAAGNVAEKINVDGYRANALPSDKIDFVKK